MMSVVSLVRNQIILDLTRLSLIFVCLFKVIKGCLIHICLKYICHEPDWCTRYSSLVKFITNHRIEAEFSLQ